MSTFLLVHGAWHGGWCWVRVADRLRAAGNRVVVPTLTGTIKLRIPPGTQNGHQLRVRGQGVPGGHGSERGDLHVVVSVQLPREVTAEERALWEQLSRVSSFKPRAH